MWLRNLITNKVVVHTKVGALHAQIDAANGNLAARDSNECSIIIVPYVQTTCTTVIHMVGNSTTHVCKVPLSVNSSNTIMTEMPSATHYIFTTTSWLPTCVHVVLT